MASPPPIESVGEEVEDVWENVKGINCVRSPSNLKGPWLCSKEWKLVDYQTALQLIKSSVTAIDYNEVGVLRGQYPAYPTRLLYHDDEPPNKGETLAVHGCHCLGDVGLRMREVLARRRVGVFVPLTLINAPPPKKNPGSAPEIRVDPPSSLSQQLPHALCGAGD
ncbi:unnamed protein product [Porites evermanni]|uniref:Uncharacterized protein n=1 Tax=Porites evermanni TaxID=104178 RepID=A0ABN8MM05_9CNID|nr:unnamed protein product [Porites evermanni]